MTLGEPLMCQMCVKNNVPVFSVKILYWDSVGITIKHLHNRSRTGLALVQFLTRGNSLKWRKRDEATGKSPIKY